MVAPRRPRFDGVVYALIDHQTASASEPLVHLLGASGRATLVGERTAGAMLAAPPHMLGDGWVLILPEADFYAADGTRLEGVGVAPHVATSSADAMVHVADRIRERDPYAATVLLAESYTTSEWPPTANGERWWREALRLARDSVPALRALGFVYQGQKRWADAFEMWERVLAHEPGDRIALYQTGRTAVFSGERLERGEAALRAYLRRPQETGEPSYAAAHWRLGAILLVRGDRAGARREYEAARQLEPENADVLAALRELSR
ncbi:MAG: hypothetical protein NVS9B3_08750 [Gemmatimonadaceae bacterium]